MAYEDMDKLTWGSHEQEHLSDEAFKKYTNQIADLISAPDIRTNRLSNRGYVIAINGGWGVGKTSFTWKLVNAVEELARKQEGSHEIVTHYVSLLPFGNTSESLTIYLQRFANKVWYEFGIDIRKDIRQFILEATPKYEYKATFSMGPLQLSRNIRTHGRDSVSDRIKMAMQSLKNGTILLFIDDIDRLKQEEVITVLRMIEKMRKIPNVMILLPMHRRVVRNALETHLALGPDSRHFLNKIVDYEVYLQNSLADLKSAFLGSCDVNISRKEFNKYRYSNKDIIWYMTLFHLILGEAILQWDISMQNDREPSLVLESQSAFLRSIYDIISYNTNGITPNMGKFHLYPIYVKGSDGKYKAVASSKAFDLKRYSTTLQKDHLARLRALDIAAAKIVRGINITSDEGELEITKNSKKDPVFFEVFLELLQKSKSEKIITDNYKLREMALIASRISAHVDISSEEPNGWQDIFKVISTVCDEFIA